MYFFLHVPKCAGTTFIQWADQCFVKDEILPEHDRFLGLQQFSDKDLQQYVWLRGHFPYDVLMPRLTGTVFRMIMLRDPVEMFLSHVEMRLNRYYPDEKLSERLRGKQLEDVLKDDVALAYFNNFAVKMLGGGFSTSTAIASDPTDAWSQATLDLDLALERLRRFEFIGLVEWFDDSLALLSKQWGLPYAGSYRRANVSGKRRRRSDLSEQVIEKIKAINALDMALYAEAVHLFSLRQQQVQVADVFQDFTGHVADRIEDDLMRVFPGQGWYPGERHPVHGIIRWTGPGRSSQLYYPLRPGKARKIRIEIVNSALPDGLASLQVLVNGRPVRGTIASANEHQINIWEATVASDLWQRTGLQNITLQVARTVQLASEKRELGLCVRKITIE